MNKLFSNRNQFVNISKGIMTWVVILLNVCGLVRGGTLRPHDAVVLVASAGFQKLVLGNGFAVGDGTLIVSAHHIVFNQSKTGRHLMEGRITVFSPYLGDACHGEIIAADEGLDLAVVHVPWRGHPALELASDQEIMMADHLRTTRIMHVIQTILDDPNYALAPQDLYQSDTQAVDFVAARTRIPRFVQLVQAGRLEQGWSGSPMVVPDSGKVVACFTSLHRRAGEGSEAWHPLRPRGAAVSQLRHLLASAQSALLEEGTQTLAGDRLSDSIPAFLSCVRGRMFNRPGTYSLSMKSSRPFIELRPDNPIGYEFMAYALDHLDRKDEARAYYEKALQREPLYPELELIYSQFLGKVGEGDKALKILQGLRDRGKLRDSVYIGMVNILGEQGRFDRCVQLLDEALQDSPRNAYLWQQKAGCLTASQGMQPDLEVARCMEKAVTLQPDIGPLRGNLARLYQALGHHDEAESHFRQLLVVEPNNPVVYFWLAEFLAKFRAGAEQEALRYAEQALRMPRRPKGPSREDLERLIVELRADLEPSKDIPTEKVRDP